MAHVTIRINGYAYTVGCEDGQEQHLMQMAAEIEQRITSIKEGIGVQSGEAKLLMLASLMLADELHDQRTTAAAKAAPKPENGERRARLRRVAARAEEIAADLLEG
jgi:cell division protein ZapA